MDRPYFYTKIGRSASANRSGATSKEQPPLLSYYCTHLSTLVSHYKCNRKMQLPVDLIRIITYPWLPPGELPKISVKPRTDTTHLRIQSSATAIDGRKNPLQSAQTHHIEWNKQIVQINSIIPYRRNHQLTLRWIYLHPDWKFQTNSWNPCRLELKLHLSQVKDSQNHVNEGRREHEQGSRSTHPRITTQHSTLPWRTHDLQMST